MAGLAAAVATGAVAAVLYQTLGLARARYEVTSGLAQLAEISWHELQVLIGLGLRGRGLGAINSGDHEDTQSGASDLLLTDGSALQVLRVKHGGGVQVDDHTIFDLATRRDARRASSAMLATTGKVSRSGELAAKDASITLLAGESLWALVSEHLPPRLRERIANRRRTALRHRLGILIGGSALAGAVAMATTFHLTQSDFGSAPAELVIAPPAASAFEDLSSGDKPATASAANTPAPPSSSVTPSPTPRAAVPTAPVARAKQVPLTDDELLVRRRDSAATVRTLPSVFSAHWSTASTLEVALRPNADLQDDGLFERVCAILAETDDLRVTRVQLQLKDADPAKGLAARWRQCQ